MLLLVLLAHASQLSNFPFSALILLVGWQERHLVCKKLGVGLLVVTNWLKLCTSYSSSCHHLHPLLAPIKSRMEIFWYRLTQVRLEKLPVKQRERVSCQFWHCYMLLAMSGVRSTVASIYTFIFTLTLQTWQIMFPFIKVTHLFRLNISKNFF